MPSPNLKILNDLNFDSVLGQATGAVLVDFTAAWCPPCKRQSEVLEHLAEDVQMLIGVVDVDECPDLASRFGIRGMPTLLVFRQGREAARHVGLANEQAVRQLLTETAV